MQVEIVQEKVLACCGIVNVLLPKCTSLPGRMRVTGAVRIRDVYIDVDDSNIVLSIEMGRLDEVCELRQRIRDVVVSEVAVQAVDVKIVP